MKTIQQDFNEYYQSLYGERWESLHQALRSPEKQVRRYNILEPEILSLFSSKKTLAREGESATSAFERIGQPFPWCQWNEAAEAIPRSSHSLLSYYVLDPASVLVAENLKVGPGEKVLDLCAAPGGKSLILAQALFRSPHEKSELILNEFSADRRERLKKVIQQYIPANIRPQVWVRGKDGTRLGLEIQNYFDAILVDAPCSGERHLLENPKALKEWKPQRTKGLAQKQYSLLCSAWLALKPGGRLMYSTCALSPLENDEVIAKFLKKKTDARWQTLALRSPAAEETEKGIIYLPDQCGFGPMYSSLLIKET